MVWCWLLLSCGGGEPAEVTEGRASWVVVPTRDVAPGEVGRREMDRYLSRLSGPLLDRIDIHAEAPSIPWRELRSGRTGTGTPEMREQAARARERQRERQGGGRPNARLSGRELDALAPMVDEATDLLGRAIAELIVHGAFQTIDLAAFGYERVAAGRPLREANVV